ARHREAAPPRQRRRLTAFAVGRNQTATRWVGLSMPAPSSLASRIEVASGSAASVTFVNPAGADRVPFGQLHDEARSLAAALQRRGVWQGSHVALLGPTTRALYTAI